MASAPPKLSRPTKSTMILPSVSSTSAIRPSTTLLPRWRAAGAALNTRHSASGIVTLTLAMTLTVVGSRSTAGPRLGGSIRRKSLYASANDFLQSWIWSVSATMPNSPRTNCSSTIASSSLYGYSAFFFYGHR